MKIKNKFDFSDCALVEIILVAFIVLFTILRQNAAISFCFALSFIVLLLYVI